MKTSNTVTLSDSGNLSEGEQHDLALALARAVPSELRNLTNLKSTLRNAQREETYQRVRFARSCDKTELPHHSVVGDWAKALKAVEAAEVAIAEAVGEINYWWVTSEGQTA